jgi:hypothetical protein
MFVKVVEPATENGQLLVEDNFCMKGHDLKEQISKRLVNCVAKNLCKELRTAANPPSEISAKKRNFFGICMSSQAKNSDKAFMLSMVMRCLVNPC